MKKGKLIFFSGKMGAGKTTRSIELRDKLNAALFSEDVWLESIYPGKIKSLQDYVKYSSLLKPQIKNMVQNILSAGTNVVMDFPGNTVSQRNWLREIYSEVGASHELIYIDAPDKVCLKQIEKRRTEQPERSATDTPEMFHAMSRYFEAPNKSEGFNVTIVAINA